MGGAKSLPAPGKNAGVAQLVEHVIRNDGVGGSSPFTGTILPGAQVPLTSAVCIRFGMLYPVFVP